MIEVVRWNGNRSAKGKSHPENAGENAGENADMILAALRQNATLTIPELASHIGKSESAVERAIKKLREEKKLERIGPAKGGRWKVLI